MATTGKGARAGNAEFSRTALFHYLPALVALAALLVVGFFADWQRQKNEYNNLRNVTSEQLGLIKAKLDANISGNLKLVQGLVGTLETEPDMAQPRFAELGWRIMRRAPQIRNVAAARGFVVNLVYPLQGNEKVIGLDYRNVPQQKEAALRVRFSARPIVTGPVNLVQGGTGLIARFPVYFDTASGVQRFWGIVSAVMDLEKLYRDSGLSSQSLPIRVAIASEMPDGRLNPAFYGEDEIFRQRPVVMRIKLGHEDWQLSAIPKAGWEMPRNDLWQFRAVLLSGGILILAPMLWAGRLMQERERNIRTLQDREDELTALSHRLQVALETSKIGIWEYDIATNGLIWDDRMRDLYGVDPSKPVAGYEDWASVLHPDDFEKAEQEFAAAKANDDQYESKFRVISSSGAIRHIRAIGAPYRDSKGHKKIVGVNWDVTADIHLQDDLRTAKLQAELQNIELEQARMRMESAALHDALTGLPNRRYLDQIMVERERVVTDVKEASVTILHIDLDRFKDINDTLGHAAGDVILKHAAAVLRENIFPDDFLARIGGDEFVIISNGTHDEEEYGALAARLVEAMSRPIDFEGHECRVGASIGLASRSNDDGIDQLLINADIALYEAKRRGRNRVERFTDTLRHVAINTKRTADEILRGLEQNEFVAWYQPQFDAQTLEIVGLEALARWDHPSKGILGPDSFLRIAENLKVVASIDEIVLQQALMQRYRLAASGFHIPKVSVNISAQRLADESLVNKLKQLTFQPGSLSFELLESISFDGDDEELIPQIEKLKELGVDIEIDDFGTGYASIVTLLKLTPRRLKIDRQLIRPLSESLAQRQLVSSIIEIGKARGIEIVAEGVETSAHAEILRDLGCDTLQGYAFAPALSPTDLLTFVRERKWFDRFDFVSAKSAQSA